MRTFATRQVFLLLIGNLTAISSPGCGPRNQGASTLASEEVDGGGFLTKEQLIAAAAAEEKGSYEEDAADDGESLVALDELFEDATTLDFDLPLEGEKDGAGTYAAQDIDLRSYDTPIKNQGKEGLCTAFGTVAAMENLARQKTGTAYNLSERHLWSTYKRYSTAKALGAATKNDVVPETVWPYNEGRPTGDVASQGLMRITRLSSGVSGFNGMLQILAASKPLVIGVTTTSPFTKSGGVIQVHNRESGMGHAMAVVGAMYDQKFEGGGLLILKNSWGASRGDKGYVYMPFAYCKYHRCAAWGVEEIAVKGASGGGGGSSGGTTPPPSGTDLSIDVKYGAYDGSHKEFRLALAGGSVGDVQSVRYHSHKTFGDGEYDTVSDASSGDFASRRYLTYASGWRTGSAVVTLKDGRTVELPGVTVTWSK